MEKISNLVRLFVYFMNVLRNICTFGLEIRILGQFEKVLTSPENHKPKTTLKLKFGFLINLANKA